MASVPTVPEFVSRSAEPWTTHIATTTDRTRRMVRWAADSASYRHRRYSPVTVVAGSTRSGTTWLTEVLNQDRIHRQYFEPFDLLRNPELVGFHRHHYLAPDDLAPAERDPIRRVLEGRVHHRRIVEHNPVPSGPRSNSLLIKAVWANLMLPWIAPRYPGIGLVLIVRHPGAVAHSRLRLGWSSHLGDMMNQPALMAALGDLAPVVAAARTPFERQVTAWAIDNTIPIRGLPVDRYQLVRFEDLVADPVGGIGSICRGAGLPLPSDLARRAAVPSVTDWNRPSGRDDRAWGWRRHTTPAEMATMNRIVAAFGLGSLYPDVD